MKKILILGASSEIAHATCKIYARLGYKFVLMARDKDKLKTIAQDLRNRGASDVKCFIMDINKISEHSRLIKKTFIFLGSIDITLISHGTLPDQIACERSAKLTAKELNTNAISTILFLTNLANELEKHKKGIIAVITSVAGDRGRASNYVYGSAKAMVSTFLQGLRGRLAKKGIHIVDIKPGIVETRMTAHLKKRFFWANPDKIAKEIMQAISKEKHSVYAPWHWWLIMKFVNFIPEFIFKKIKL